MIEVQKTFKINDNESFMIRHYWYRTICTFDVEGTCLSAKGCFGHLSADVQYTIPLRPFKQSNTLDPVTRSPMSVAKRFRTGKQPKQTTKPEKKGRNNGDMMTHDSSTVRCGVPNSYESYL